jgi:O-antigen/teichoic acid export membrane protein
MPPSRPPRRLQPLQPSPLVAPPLPSQRQSDTPPFSDDVTGLHSGPDLSSDEMAAPGTPDDLTLGGANRRRTSTRDVAWSMTSEGLLAVTAIVSVRLLTNSLSKPDVGLFYGIYGFVGLGVSLFASWPLLVISQSIVRDEEDAESVVHSTFAYLFMLSAIGLVLVAVLGAWRLPGLPVTTMLAIGGSDLFGTAIVGALAGLAQATLGVREAAKCRIAGSATRLVVLATLAATGFSLLRIGVGYLIGFAITSTVLAFRLRSLLGFFPRPGRQNPAHLRQGIQFMAGAGANTLTEDGDKMVMASQPELRSDNAAYAVAYRFALLGALPLNVLTQASHAEFVQRGASRNEHVRRTAKYTGIAFVYAVLFCAGVYVLGRPVLNLVAPKIPEAASILRWISLLLLLRAGRNFSQNALLGLGKLRVRLGINIGVAITSMVMYLALIPHWSWKGAVATTLVAEALTVAATWVALLKYQREENAALPTPVG